MDSQTIPQANNVNPRLRVLDPQGDPDFLGFPFDRLAEL